MTDVRIERNKLNLQRQRYHLEEARAIRDIRMKRQNRDWRQGNGRPNVREVIRAFLLEHPTASKAEVIRGIGKDKKTVYKYYEDIKKEIGVELGQQKVKKVKKPDNWDAVLADWRDGKITARKAMELTGIKQATFYRLVKEDLSDVTKGQ